MAEKNQQFVTFENMMSLIKAVSEAGIESFEYQEGDVSVKLKGKTQIQTVNVSSAVAAPAVAAMSEASLPAAPKASADSAIENKVQEGNIINSPLVGIFYTSPSETGAPFVKVGDTVKKGQTIAIIEAMKMMNEIESEFDGTVAEVYCKNEGSVEYGQPLFRIV